MTRGGRVHISKDCTMVTVTGPGAQSVISDLEQQNLSHSQHGTDLPCLETVMDTFCTYFSATIGSAKLAV